eukprot:m.267603 g.267603  ORF g.267603 m.267603 type:complete len:394 (-) comp74073_c0_seq1:194-1375(-)
MMSVLVVAPRGFSFAFPMLLLSAAALFSCVDSSGQMLSKTFIVGQIDASNHVALPTYANLTYAIKTTSYPLQPSLNYLAHNSPWEFPYNPAFIPGHNGLLVRVQNGTTSPPGQCSKPITNSFMAFAPFSTNGSMKLERKPVFGPAMTAWEQSAEDPRVIYENKTKTWYMTYTANGNVSQPPLNRHQGIATSQSPLTAGTWQRQCSAANPCLAPGLKSGAMLPRVHGPHYMFVYDLTKNCPSNPGGVCRHTVVTTSHDLVHWTVSNRTLLPRRPGMWDAGLIEPGPPPLELANGNYLFFYNGATLPNDREYHVGWAVLDQHDPTKVIQRSEEPVLSWSDRPWMIGNSSKYICYTPTVVFCNGARPLGNDTFELFFGGADAVVGRATVVVTTTAS